MSLSKDGKVKSLCTSISTCGEDIYTLSNELKKTYLNEELSVDNYIDELKKVVNTSLKLIHDLEKEILR